MLIPGLKNDLIIQIDDEALRHRRHGELLFYN